MTLKPALNYEEQITKLKVDHNLKIKDEIYATEILKKSKLLQTFRLWYCS